MLARRPNRLVRSDRRAITCVELLIAFMIIVILSAIAVPNFIEASGRTSVPRVMSDMRNVGVAMKRYRIDQNVWPNFNWDGVGVPGQIQIGWIMRIPGNCPPNGMFTGGGEYLGKFLTTPVPYMSSIPLDDYNSNIPEGYVFY